VTGWSTKYGTGIHISIQQRSGKKIATCRRTTSVSKEVRSWEGASLPLPWQHDSLLLPEPWDLPLPTRQHENIHKGRVSWPNFPLAPVLQGSISSTPPYWGPRCQHMDLWGTHHIKSLARQSPRFHIGKQIILSPFIKVFTIWGFSNSDY
jgi:hypothetical protein